MTFNRELYHHASAIACIMFLVLILYRKLLLKKKDIGYNVVLQGPGSMSIARMAA